MPLFSHNNIYENGWTVYFVDAQAFLKYINKIVVFSTDEDIRGKY